MEIVELIIQLDNLRLAMDDALCNKRDIAEIKILHQAIKKKELQLKKVHQHLN